jgi:cell division protein ZapA (FtsZ GTPase activity inhibitor)
MKAVDKIGSISLMVFTFGIIIMIISSVWSLTLKITVLAGILTLICALISVARRKRQEAEEFEQRAKNIEERLAELKSKHETYGK